jgi:hypothetical protein
MASLSIGRAWEETAAFAQREGRLVFPVAFLLMALPGAIFQALTPVTRPGEAPEAGLWLLFLPVLFLASIVGSLAICHLALRPGASVGEALQLGLRRFPAMFGAALLVGLAAGLLMIPIIILLVMAVMGGGAANPEALVPLLILLMLPPFVFFWIRLVLLTPVVAAEPVGPIAAIQRSWALTRGHFWRLLGFLLLGLVVALVVMVAVSAIVGIVIILVAGQPQPGSVAMFLVLLLSAVIQAVIGALFTTFLARIYVQLAGTADSTADVFS